MAGHLNSKNPTVKPEKMGSLLWEMLFAKNQRRPPYELPTHPVDVAAWKNESGDSLIWLGHSTYLMRVNGLTILVDPMLANSYSPVFGIGGRRYSRQLPVQAANLGAIDVVLVTHNHYDHLNRQTVQQIRSNVNQFIVPIGVSPLLRKWGVSADRIVELDWWHSHGYGDVTFTATPAKHFSGRGLTDRNRTGWCAYVVASPQHRIYCGGDSGYGNHFAEIGKQYGPFDLTILECGQYNDNWAEIHMRPEETVQAHLDLGGTQLLPVHWAGFTLSMHDWDEPIRRVVAAAKQQHVTLATPHIGEACPIGAAQHAFTAWWENLQPES